MIERQIWNGRWTEEIIAIDDLASLVDEDAAVAWDRDVATAPGLPWDGMPRFYENRADHVGYKAHCVVFGRPMGYWVAVAVWLDDDKRWDVRRRRAKDRSDYDLADYINPWTWIQIATGSQA